MFVLNFYEKCYVKLNNECVFLFFISISISFVLILCNRMHLMKEHGMDMIYIVYIVCMYMAQYVCSYECM